MLLEAAEFAEHVRLAGRESGDRLLQLRQLVARVRQAGIRLGIVEDGCPDRLGLLQLRFRPLPQFACVLVRDAKHFGRLLLGQFDDMVGDCASFAQVLLSRLHERLQGSGEGLTESGGRCPGGNVRPRVGIAQHLVEADDVGVHVVAVIASKGDVKVGARFAPLESQGSQPPL